jgi:hypothetical protein
LTAALVADCDRDIVAAAAAVLPVSATTRKICSCRRVSRGVPTKQIASLTNLIARFYKNNPLDCLIYSP